MSHYQQLSINEREHMLKLSAAEKEIREMSRALGQSAGTISRELRRNRGKDGYWPSTAEQNHLRRKTKCRWKRIIDDPETWRFTQ